MLPRIGPVELILILVIVTMLFGVGKLPEVFGAVGRGVREFRKGAAEGLDEATPETAETQPETPAAPEAAPQVAAAEAGTPASPAAPIAATNGAEVQKQTPAASA
jgi:sec-independent protein translocase protein TatA